MNIRHLTPSMSLLLSFDTAAQHQSYAEAAKILSLTPSAISKQIQALEAHLQLKLFEKSGRNVQLTAAGQRYHQEIKQAISLIRAATLQMLSRQSESTTLRLAILPTFGSKWLLPKLHQFYQRYPQHTIHILSRIGTIQFETDEVDAAITVGHGNWPNQIAIPLQTEQLVAIASPNLVEGDDPETDFWLAKQNLLAVSTHDKAWQQWFQFHHKSPLPAQETTFEVTSHLIQAVRAGMGVGIVPVNLIEDELQRGDLVEIGKRLPSSRHYYLVYPQHHASLPALQAFVSWIKQLPSD